MNEAETRAEHIDPALKEAGWGVVEGSRIHREYLIAPGRLEGYGLRAKPEIADYILMYRNHKLAVIEAKAWDKALTEGAAQAKSYAAKMSIRFAYTTNGQGLYKIDMKRGTESEVATYPTPQELWDLTFADQNDWRDRFAVVPFEDKSGTLGERYFRDIAIERVLEAIAAEKQRILLTLATGTGKTMIAFQIAWKLFYSRWNLSREPERRPRILFLADRNILADQAYNAFSAFPEDALVRIAPEDIRKKGRVPKNGSLFFSIFQTFMSGPPKDGINDGFLTPFRVKQIQTTLDYYVFTPDDTVVEGEIEAGKLYDEPDFNKIIEIREREKKRVEILMQQINQNEKTLVFCANQAHALVVRDLINQMKTSNDPNYCQRVTANDGALGEQHLRDFQDNEKTIPTILTTSQKLATGVDARNIRNIALMRPINSMIEFKQIIGRGTRPYDGKDYFTIYDFVKAHHHFNDPEWDGEPLEPEPREPRPAPPAGPPLPPGPGPEPAPS